MNKVPTPDGICRLLDRAQDELVVALKVKETTVSIRMNALPASFRGLHGDGLATRLISDGAWDTDAPAFQTVQQWVERCWNEL